MKDIFDYPKYAHKHPFKEKMNDIYCLSPGKELKLVKVEKVIIGGEEFKRRIWKSVNKSKVR